MFHVRAPKRLIVGMLVLVFGLVVVQSSAATTVIPYLSHGIGRRQDSGTSTTPLVIPYLSHGIGVDKSLYSGQSHQLRRASSTRSRQPGPRRLSSVRLRGSPPI